MVGQRAGEVSRSTVRPAAEAICEASWPWRLAGYVRHSSSDAAAGRRLAHFLAAAIPRVEKAVAPAALAAELQAVFTPIAPTVRVFATGKEPELPAELLPPESAGPLKVRYWEHLGYQQDDAVKMEDVYSSQRKSIDVGTPAEPACLCPAGRRVLRAIWARLPVPQPTARCLPMRPGRFPA
jgi:hypothetical protein